MASSKTVEQQQFVSVKIIITQPAFFFTKYHEIATEVTITAAPKATVIPADYGYTIKSIGTVSKGTSIVEEFPTTTP
jgi:hypothetical protein